MTETFNGEVYSSCEELPMYNYIRCVVHGDMSYLLHKRNLVEAGNRHAELMEVWDKIQSEYVQLIEKSLDVHALNLNYKIEADTIRLTVINELLDLMPVYRLPQFGDMLRDQGFLFKFDPSDDEGYENDLKRVFNRKKRIEFDIEENKKQLQSKKKSDKKIDVAFFDSILTSLSKFMGSHVDERIITVSRYASILNSFTAYIEELQNKKDLAEINAYK